VFQEILTDYSGAINEFFSYWGNSRQFNTFILKNLSEGRGCGHDGATLVLPGSLEFADFKEGHFLEPFNGIYFSSYHLDDSALLTYDAFIKLLEELCTAYQKHFILDRSIVKKRLEKIKLEVIPKAKEGYLIDLKTYEKYLTNH